MANVDAATVQKRQCWAINELCALRRLDDSCFDGVSPSATVSSHDVAGEPGLPLQPELQSLSRQRWPDPHRNDGSGAVGTDS